MTVSISRPVHSAAIGDDDAPVRAVFLHGLFGRGKNFTTIAQALAPEVQSLMVDLPNHGQSGWTERFDYADLADLVAEHLRAGFAAHGPVAVIGHSMGGKVAMVLALRHPDLVRRLVVIDISPDTGGEVRGEFPHLLSALASLDLRAVHKRGEASAALREQIPNSTVRGFLMQNLKREGDGFVWEPNLALLRAELDTVMGFPSDPGEPYEGPVLWMGGEKSDYVTDDDAPAMRALFPRTQRITVKGAGHWVHAEQPDTVVAALRRFLLPRG